MRFSVRLYQVFEGHEGDEILFCPQRFHYLKHVMRLCVGDRLTVFHESQGEWSVDVTRIERQNMWGALREQMHPPVESETKRSAHLVCPILRPHRMGFLLEKACELGVTRLTPLLTDHTVHRHVHEKKWRQILVESAEQCGRLDTPQLDNVMAWQEFWSHVGNNMVAVAYERCDQAISLSSFLNQSEKSFIGLVGPEGGWSEHEKSDLRNHAYACLVDLGPRILRSETAALSMLAGYLFY